MCTERVENLLLLAKGGGGKGASGATWQQARGPAFWDLMMEPFGPAGPRPERPEGCVEEWRRREGCGECLEVENTGLAVDVAVGARCAMGRGRCTRWAGGPWPPSISM